MKKVKLVQSGAAVVKENGVSRFYWPEPDLSFLPGAKAIGEGEARYFVCHNNNILQLVDEKEAWRPATREELGQFDGVHEHYMGTLSGKKCFAVHVSEPGSAGFASLRMNIQNIGPTLFNLAGRALQVCDWYRSHQFCGRCGKPTTDSKRDRSTVCAGCKLNFYPRLSPSIIVLVHSGGEVLLGRNHMFPEGLFSTLAGFVEPGESSFIPEGSLVVGNPGKVVRSGLKLDNNARLIIHSTK